MWGIMLNVPNKWCGRAKITMFMGEYHPSFDEKGRIAIPARLRKAFGEDAVISRLVIAPSFDKCIMAFREKEWGDFVQNKLVALSQGEQKNRMKIRFLMGGAAECDLDKQGRIIIPPNLKEYAEIDGDITILGVYDKIEIWSTKIYNEYRPDKDTLDSFAAELGF
ncbi:MAG: division/cell wall cluster transcriptional repressor MraZ [Spirochaetes bacterium]|nr:division/cell wall cluster transcriptional repressor MraZ [Spirochaetota bacterium]